MIWCDIDGVLVNDIAWQAWLYVLKTSQDPRYYQLVGESLKHAEIYTNMVNMIKELSEIHPITLITGRPGFVSTIREATEMLVERLIGFGVRIHDLYMRPKDFSVSDHKLSVANKIKAEVVIEDTYDFLAKYPAKIFVWVVQGKLKKIIAAPIEHDRPEFQIIQKYF